MRENAHRRQKLAILSNAVPPDRSGQAEVLRQLTSDLHKDDFCFITNKDYSKSNDRMPCDYYRIEKGGIVEYDTVLVLADKISEIIDAHSINVMVACTADLFNIPAAHIACKNKGIRFVPYIFDCYVNQWIDKNERCFARAMADIVFPGSDIIVTNKFASKKYVNNFTARPIIVRNLCSRNTSVQDNSKCKPHNGINMLYSGSLYEAQLGSVKNLISAISSRNDITLDIYSRQDKVFLERNGVVGNNVNIYGVLPHDIIVEKQRDADILFLPLSFESKYPDAMIETTSPGKVAEYLSSGTPILVHAPKNSFVSTYFSENKCGCVVSCESKDMLIDGIDAIYSDPSYANYIVDRAYGIAKRDFNRESILREFNSIVFNGERI